MVLRQGISRYNDHMTGTARLHSRLMIKINHRDVKIPGDHFVSRWVNGSKGSQGSQSKDQVELDTAPGSVETLLNSTLVLGFVNSVVPAKEGYCSSRQTMKQSTTTTWGGACCRASGRSAECTIVNTALIQHSTCASSDEV